MGFAREVCARQKEGLTVSEESILITPKEALKELILKTLQDKRIAALKDFIEWPADRTRDGDWARLANQLDWAYGECTPRAIRGILGRTPFGNIPIWDIREACMALSRTGTVMQQNSGRVTYYTAILPEDERVLAALDRINTRHHEVLKRFTRKNAFSAVYDEETGLIQLHVTLEEAADIARRFGF